MKYMKWASLFVTVVGAFLFLGGSPLLAQGRTGGMGNSGPGMGNGQPNQPNQPNPDINTPSNEPTLPPQKSPSQLIAENPKLAEKIQSLLPQGANMQSAVSGFKSLGQFVAALHASQNLGIPFDQLKGKMMAGNNLGKTIHELKPDMNIKDAKAEAKKADKQGKADIKESKS